MSLVRDLDGSLARSATPWVAPGCGSTLLHVVVEGEVLDDAGTRSPRVFGVTALLLDRPAPETRVASPSGGATCLLIHRGHFFTTINECPALIAGFLEMPAGF